jgi:hypothetical protein
VARWKKGGGRKGYGGHFPSQVHAGMRTWSATSVKLANLLSFLFDGGKNIGAILKMATEGVPRVPFGKMAKI